MTSASPSRDAEFVARLRSARIVPVLVLDDPGSAVDVARALQAGGMSCVEITFRTPRAAEALARIAAEVPGLLVGAGTVLTPAQAAEARRAGARFIVAPGFNPRVVDDCLAHDIPICPGVCTPTELEAGLEKGLATFKFFPAGPIGGIPYLKALAAPYGQVRFMPTGGINAGNVASYLALEFVVACGGSWMATTEWIAAKQFDRIRDESARALQAASGRMEQTA